MSFLYFSYGSNLLRQRLQLQNPSAVFLTIAQLKDHMLTFSNLGHDPTAMRWRGGAATIVDRPGASVWGCVWRLSKADLQSLDIQEDVYEAVDVTVVSPDAAQHVCRTYRLPASCIDVGTYDQRPSPMYMDVILRGARQNHLPDQYIQHLISLDTNGAQGHCEVYNDVLRLLSQSEAS